MTTAGSSETWHRVLPAPVGRALHSLPWAVGRWPWEARTSGGSGYPCIWEAAQRAAVQCNWGDGKACHIWDAGEDLGHRNVM